MPFVIVRAPLDLSRPHRQHRLCTIQRLNLGFLVHTEDDCLVGGFMYSPTMSRTFSISNGSVDSLNVSLRCGCRPNARQIRCIVVRPSPLAFAIPRLLQCVSPRGVFSASARSSVQSRHH